MRGYHPQGPWRWSKENRGRGKNLFTCGGSIPDDPAAMKDFIKRLFDREPPLDAARTRMRADWDRRARENAMHFVADFKEQWEDEGEFFRTGEDDVARFLREANWTPEMTGNASLLEIGCGVGRMTRALAGRFAFITAVDVSGEMLVRAYQANSHLQNVHFMQVNGSSFAGIADNSYDFAFSYIVFQHMPHADLIYEYVADTLRVLKPGGRFRFQARNDFLLVKHDTYDGASVDIPRVRDIANRLNASVESISGQGTQMCYIELRKS
ncbi:class I SAM-dependent methyltransferase [Candidatus Sumerlaeota bacterium]|nr:class I SAM-dependent methyltransferase [Candidatus Sumerlaeota bacterium]